MGRKRIVSHTYYICRQAASSVFFVPVVYIRRQSPVKYFVNPESPVRFLGRVPKQPRHLRLLETCQLSLLANAGMGYVQEKAIAEPWHHVQRQKAKGECISKPCRRTRLHARFGLNSYRPKVVHEQRLIPTRSELETLVPSVQPDSFAFSSTRIASKTSSGDVLALSCSDWWPKTSAGSFSPLPIRNARHGCQEL